MPRTLPLRALWLLVPPALVMIWAIWLHDPSDQERIERLCRRAARAFDGGDASDCVAELATDFSLEGRRLDRAGLRSALASFFLRERGGLFGESPWRVELPREALWIDLAPDSGADARVELQAEFRRRRSQLSASQPPDWVACIELELRRVGNSFEVVRATTPRTLSGRALFP